MFQAIADPTRREIINLLASESMNLNALADNFNISRPAVSKHIKILTECGLVSINQQGRERYCEAKLDSLNEVADWVEQYKKIWVKRFEMLDKFLLDTQKKSKKIRR